MVRQRAGLTVVVVDVASRAVTRFRAPCFGAVSWSPDATRLLCVSTSQRVLVLDGRGRRLLALKGVGAQWIAPHQLAVVTRPFETHVVDSAGALLATLRGAPFAVSRDGRFVALTRAGLLEIADARTGRLLKKIAGPPHWDTGGAFTPDGSELAYFAPDSSYAIVPVSGTGRSHPLPPNGTWSNDGRAYAFLRLGPGGDRVDVLVGDRYGAHARAIGRFPWDDHGDSTLLAGRRGHFFYESSVRPHKDLWSIRSDGRGLHRLTNAGDVRDPAWSPRGDRLALAVAEFSGGLCGYCSPRVIVATPSGKRVAMLPSDAEDGNPTWSPDGRRLAVEHGLNGEIDVVGFDGINRLGIVTEGGFAPAWSPDGKTIAYTSYSNGVGIHLIAADGAGDRLVVANASAPAWSPDGRALAFVRNGVIFVTSATDRARARRLAVGDEPAFSPSGASIVFSRHHGIFVINVDGSGLRRLTTTAYDDRAPAWRPS